MQTLNSLTDEQRLDLFEKNKRLAFYVAHRHGVGALPRDEREQAALIGLNTATRHWEEEKGPFAVYAAVIMRREIQRTIDREILYHRTDGSVGVGLCVVSQMMADFDALAEILPDDHMNPEDQLVQIEAALWEVDQERIRKRALIDATPLRKRSWSGHTYTNCEVMERLTQGQTQSHVADVLGVSRQRIGQIVQATMREIERQ